MPAVTNSNADAFLRKYLKQPSDATARLVFADWLEETGAPHNCAWAHFIRLKAEADRYPPNSPTRYELDRHAGVYAVQIRARLTIPAKLFVGYPKSLLQLLPEPNFTVSLARFRVPRAVRELVPESVARENLVLPLAAQEQVMIGAAADPNNIETAQRLQFVLNREIILVAADRDDIRSAIDRAYGAGGTGEAAEAEPGAPLVVLMDRPGPYDIAVRSEPEAPVPPPDAENVVRLVNLLLVDAINQRANCVLLYPGLEEFVVRQRVAGAWVERDRLSARFLRPFTGRLAFLAGIDPAALSTDPGASFDLSGVISFQMPPARFRVSVRVESSPGGPITQLDLAEEPA